MREKKKKKNRDVLRHFKSVRSALFAAISVMVLCAVVIVVAISLRFTRTSVFDNAGLYQDDCAPDQPEYRFLY